MTQQDEPRYVQEADADLSALVSKNVTIVGYGNLGRPLALNLKDSGVSPVTVAELPGPAWGPGFGGRLLCEARTDRSRRWGNCFHPFVRRACSGDLSKRNSALLTAWDRCGLCVGLQPGFQ